MPIYKDESDKRLVELTLCGDGRAFEELVVRHEKAVLGTAYKITRDHYRAEDVAQEAFVAAWMQLERLTSQDKFGSYVCAIAKNCAKKMVMRDSRLSSTVSLTDFENCRNTAEGNVGRSRRFWGCLYKRAKNSPSSIFTASRVIWQKAV